ncbi:MAG TPA: TetR/AcrR family transcriptional regulator [Polyangiaceae bacterium]
MSELRARKKPIQERSRATVEAILEASLRVLVDVGFDKLTTTRVADVAGVGVGTLYQYFPSKESLLYALLEEQMAALEDALLGAMAGSEGQSLEARVAAVIDALVVLKRRSVHVTLHGYLDQIDGRRVVKKTMRKITSGIASMIAPHVIATDAELELIAQVVASSIQGAIEAVLDNTPGTLAKPSFRDALVKLTLGYLRESGCDFGPRRKAPSTRGSERRRSTA